MQRVQHQYSASITLHALCISCILCEPVHKGYLGYSLRRRTPPLTSAPPETLPPTQFPTRPPARADWGRTVLGLPDYTNKSLLDWTRARLVKSGLCVARNGKQFTKRSTDWTVPGLCVDRSSTMPSRLRTRHGHTLGLPDYAGTVPSQNRHKTRTVRTIRTKRVGLVDSGWTRG